MDCLCSSLMDSANLTLKKIYNEKQTMCKGWKVKVGKNLNTQAKVETHCEPRKLTLRNKGKEKFKECTNWINATGDDGLEEENGTSNNI